MKLLHVHRNLWRSDRPRNSSDLSQLDHHRIKRIISLEEGWGSLFGWREERLQWVGVFGGLFSHFPMSNFFPPSKDECETILKILDDGFNTQTVVHCYSGVDRTGIVCAYYLWKKGLLTRNLAWKNAVDNGQHFWFRWWKPYFLRMCVNE